MNRVRLASVLLGGGFGFILSWAHFVDPDQIRRMLLFQEPYMWEMFAVAVGVGFVGLRVMRRLGLRSLLTGEPVRWSVAKPQRRHLVGATIFGAGWAVSDVCPGPVAAQLGQGVIWSLPLLAGIGIGIALYFRREQAPTPRTKRAARRRPASAAAPVALPASNPD